jgi:PEP-CTERM motif
MIEAREQNDIGSAQVAIDDSITVSLANPGLSFGDLIFNLFNGGPLGAGGPFTIVVNGFDTNDDPVSTTFTQDSDNNPLSIGNGGNFYTIFAIDGQHITSVEISPNFGTSYAELRQIRVSGIVPEPASAMLIAMGVVTFIARRRR